MRRLHIGMKAANAHRKAFGDGILKLLRALGDGQSVNCVGKNNEIDEWMPALQDGSISRGYFKLLAERFAEGDFLLMRLKDMVSLCESVDNWEKCLLHENPTREVREELKNAKMKLSRLFNYRKFGLGEKLVVDDSVKPICFHWSAYHNEWSAWHFIKSLHVRSCCYCNAETIFSLLLDNKKPGQTKLKHTRNDYKRSALDHYFPQSQYPYLALCLYNLVPACTRCNTNIKGAEHLDYKRHIYPYGEHFDEGFRFVAAPKTSKDWKNATEEDFSIFAEKNEAAPEDLSSRANNTANFFHLGEFYDQFHKCDALDIIRRVTMLPKGLRDMMERLYPGISELVLNRILVGSDMKRSHLNLRPLSKLHADLYEEFHGKSK